jgi:hypothetical protein
VTAPEVSRQGGGYLAKSTPAEPGGMARDEAQAHRLWTLSEQLCGTSATT